MVLDRSPKLDRVFHALAHPARRAILRQLSEREQNLSELAAPLKMSFPAASKHVRVLERARLVKRRVVGRTHICWIEGRPLAEASEWLEGYRRVWEGSFERLDALLEEMMAQGGPSATQGAAGPDPKGPAPKGTRSKKATANHAKERKQ